MAQAFLRELTAARPELAAPLGELSQLHEQKLWHELTLLLEDVVLSPAFCAPGDDVLVSLYARFVSDFEAKLNPLKLATLAVAVSSRLSAGCGKPAEASAFLAGCLAKAEAAPLAARIYLRTHVALLAVQTGDLAAAKEGVEQCKGWLDSLASPEASVAAAVHFTASQLAKATQDFAGFYKAGLLYLAHTDVAALPEGTKLVRRPVASPPFAQTL
jgi:26S proteasome regulatory subunit N9